MALVTVQNLTASPLSTDVGLLNPGETKAMQMGPDQAYRASEGLKTLEAAGRVAVTIAEESGKLDDLEPAAVGTASVADGAVVEAKIGALAVTAGKIGAAAVTTAKIMDANVTTVKILDANVTTAKFAVGAVDATALGSNAVTTVKILDANVTHAKLDPEIEVKSADITVSSAEMLALNATPKTLIAAPAAGTAIIFEGAVVFLDYGTAAYAAIDAAGDDLAFRYTGVAGAIVAECEATGFLDLTADAMRYVRPHAAVAAADSSITPVAAAALVLHMLNSEITTGDSPLKVRVYYRVVPTVL